MLWVIQRGKKSFVQLYKPTEQQNAITTLLNVLEKLCIQPCTTQENLNLLLNTSLINEHIKYSWEGSSSSD